jgi:hypothetical protein
LIRSNKFPVDCLYFIFEQDFELYRDRGSVASTDPLGPITTSLGDPSASSSAGSHEPRGLKRKGSGDRDQPADRSAASDMVKIVTAAARQGKGDFVWLGYNPTQNGKAWEAPRVKFGTQLMCMTAAAAERMSLIIGRTTPWKANHIDMWLLKFCQDFRFSGGCCSYVFPPLGCFGGHASECCPEKGVRDTLWDEAYTSEGTRPSEDKKGQRSKKVYGMLEAGKGHVDLLCTLTEDYFTGTSGLWRTYVDLPTVLLKYESEKVRRRRRREMTLLNLRVHVDGPSTVWRLTKHGARCSPFISNPTLKGPTEPSFRPLRRTFGRL